MLGDAVGDGGGALPRLVLHHRAVEADPDAGPVDTYQLTARLDQALSAVNSRYYDHLLDGDVELPDDVWAVELIDTAVHPGAVDGPSVVEARVEPAGPADESPAEGGGPSTGPGPFQQAPEPPPAPHPSGPSQGGSPGSADGAGRGPQREPATAGGPVQRGDLDGTTAITVRDDAEWTRVAGAGPDAPEDAPGRSGGLRFRAEPPAVLDEFERLEVMSELRRMGLPSGRDAADQAFEGYLANRSVVSPERPVPAGSRPFAVDVVSIGVFGRVPEPTGFGRSGDADPAQQPAGPPHRGASSSTVGALAAYPAPIDPAVAATADAVVARLHDLAARRPSDRGAAPWMFGPDPFGTIAMEPPPTGFLAAVEQRSLPPEGLGSFFRRMDMRYPVPVAADLAPSALTRDTEVLRHQLTPAEAAKWTSRGITRVPEEFAIPRVLFGVWIGDPVSPDGGIGRDFARGFATSHRRFGATGVLVTDISRERFAAAVADRAVADRVDPGVGEMLDWAGRHHIRLVNVDELFHGGEPMPAGASYRSEVARGTGPGRAAASDLVRAALLHRFGGVYLDGGDEFRSDPLADPEVRRTGFGLTFGNGLIYNSALVGAREHPILSAVIARQLANYGRSQPEILPPGTSHDPADRADRRVAQRRSVVHRVGPIAFGQTLTALGTIATQLDGVRARGGLSWLRPPAADVARPPLIEVADTAGTAELTARVVTVLLRHLVNRPGDLWFSEVGELLARHADPAVVRRAAVRFIAGADGTRTAVRSVTHPVPFGPDGRGHPPELADLFEDVGGFSVTFRGEQVLPVRLRDLGGPAPDVPVDAPVIPWHPLVDGTWRPGPDEAAGEAPQQGSRPAGLYEGGPGGPAATTLWWPLADLSRETLRSAPEERWDLTTDDSGEILLGRRDLGDRPPHGATGTGVTMPPGTASLRGELDLRAGVPVVRLVPEDGTAGPADTAHTRSWSSVVGGLYRISRTLSDHLGTWVPPELAERSRHLGEPVAPRAGTAPVDPARFGPSAPVDAAPDLEAVYRPLADSAAEIRDAEPGAPWPARSSWTVMIDAAGVARLAARPDELAGDGWPETLGRHRERFPDGPLADADLDRFVDALRAAGYPETGVRFDDDGVPVPAGDSRRWSGLLVREADGFVLQNDAYADPASLVRVDQTELRERNAAAGLVADLLGAPVRPDTVLPLDVDHTLLSRADAIASGQWSLRRQESGWEGGIARDRASDELTDLAGTDEHGSWSVPGSELPVRERPGDEIAPADEEPPADRPWDRLVDAPELPHNLQVAVRRSILAADLRPGSEMFSALPELPAGREFDQLVEFLRSRSGSPDLDDAPAGGPRSTVLGRGLAAAYAEHFGVPALGRPGLLGSGSEDPAAHVAERLRERAAEQTEGALSAGPQLGLDPFGIIATPPPTPEFLTDVDQQALPPEKVGSFFDRLNMLARPPAPAHLTLAALPDSTEVLRHELSAAEKAEWAGRTFGPVPETFTTPKVLFGVWIGDPVSPRGGAGRMFARGFARSAREFDGPAVLVTDISRARFAAAITDREAAERVDPGVGGMADWAHAYGIRLVNVDELFHGDEPMAADAAYRSEVLRGNGRGRAAASDLLRVALLHRFGGLYMDGDDKLDSWGPDPFQEDGIEQSGFGLAPVRGGPFGLAFVPTALNNSGILGAREHPVLSAVIARQLANYGRTQPEILPPHTSHDPADRDPRRVTQRRSVIHRVGPSVFHTVLDRMGVTATPLSGVRIGQEGAWTRPADVEVPRPPLVETTDVAGTTDLTARVVTVLLRHLVNRPGDLWFSEVDELLARPAEPAVVRRAAVSFLAGVDEVRAAPAGAGRPAGRRRA
ncbi:hypothetical protein [Pseudonocardia sp. ICBG1293]|uniref:hypothetical protein n=1 Tax=Pseudonocardia sp. ICBG1293 TaxID=2844382 RepID=UPI001CCDDBA3|nr:hypothetical protein [Pseudonocardia sp. ICBG1293]